MNAAGNTAVTMASDANGDMRLFVSTGGSKSGIITAFGLPEESPINEIGIVTAKTIKKSSETMNLKGKKHI